MHLVSPLVFLFVNMKPKQTPDFANYKHKSLPNRRLYLSFYTYFLHLHTKHFFLLHASFGAFLSFYPQVKPFRHFTFQDPQEGKLGNQPTLLPQTSLPKENHETLPKQNKKSSTFFIFFSLASRVFIIFTESQSLEVNRNTNHDAMDKHESDKELRLTAHDAEAEKSEYHSTSESEGENDEMARQRNRNRRGQGGNAGFEGGEGLIGPSNLPGTATRGKGGLIGSIHATTRQEGGPVGSSDTATSAPEAMVDAEAEKKLMNARLAQLVSSA